MFSVRELQYFEVAKGLAALSTHRYYKIGAAVVKHNDVISTGFNKEKSHPLQKRYNVYRFFDSKFDECNHGIHAELDALRKVKGNLSNAALFVYRIVNESYGMCRPCKACMQIIREKGIRKIYYTTECGYSFEYLPS